jgi:hypothetical protein
MTIQAQAQIKSVDLSKKDGLKILVTSIEVSDKALKLVYKIRNESKEDVWILVGNDIWHPEKQRVAMDAEVFMSEDDQTLMIRRRRDLERFSSGPELIGRYVRLRSGESKTESIFIKLPVYPVSLFDRVKRQEKGLEYASQLVIELGYYKGNLPDIIFKMLEEKKTSRELFGFNESNECLNSREEEISISFTRNEFKKEKVSRTTVDNLRITYIEKYTRPIKLIPPDLISCTKVEFQYKPSMLEYFFPYASQQSLLSGTEMEYLKSRKNLVLENMQQLETFARDVSKAKSFNTFSWHVTGGCIRYRSKVNVFCLYDNKPSISFTIYNDDSILTKEGRLQCFKGFPSLRILTPQVKAIDLRMQCARNLENLWYRLRLYYKAEESRVKDSNITKEVIYPSSNKWCDSLLQPFYPSFGVEFPLPISMKWDKEMHVCPSAEEGKNHYAMNPNCKTDSPPDMVLLFETKAVWNQHGGPDLFTFDNHDPKGGCVLLNDGTVKFIRTKEELHQLRWE